MVCGVSIGEVDKVGVGVGVRFSNFDLGVFYVELGGIVDVGGVKGE